MSCKVAMIYFGKVQSKFNYIYQNKLFIYYLVETSIKFINWLRQRFLQINLRITFLPPSIIDIDGHQTIPFKKLRDRRFRQDVM